MDLNIIPMLSFFWKHNFQPRKFEFLTFDCKIKNKGIMTRSFSIFSLFRKFYSKGFRSNLKTSQFLNVYILLIKVLIDRMWTIVYVL